MSAGCLMDVCFRSGWRLFKTSRRRLSVDSQRRLQDIMRGHHDKTFVQPSDDLHATLTGPSQNLLGTFIYDLLWPLHDLLHNPILYYRLLCITLCSNKPSKHLILSICWTSCVCWVARSYVLKKLHFCPYFDNLHIQFRVIIITVLYPPLPCWSGPFLIN